MLIESNPAGIASSVGNAIKTAAQRTGASFQYLLATAQVESKLDPKAQAPTSTATGLFQFIEQTWLGTMKAAGSAFGFGKYADAVQQSPSGRYTVSDPDMRREILALRKDPAANAAMAGVLSRSNAIKLENRIGRAPSDGELYTAHFLGLNGAGRLIETASRNPNASAATLFPDAARANRNIFYDRGGNARSVSQVAGLMDRKMAIARTQVGIGAGTAFADASALTQVQSATNSARVNPADANTRMRSLFSDPGREGGVAPMINELWGGKTAAAAPQGQQVAATNGAENSHDLFGNTPRNIGAMFRGA